MQQPGGEERMLRFAFEAVPDDFVFTDTGAEARVRGNFWERTATLEALARQAFPLARLLDKSNWNATSAGPPSPTSPCPVSISNTSPWTRASPSTTFPSMPPTCPPVST
jgi:hypothetical protein